MRSVLLRPALGFGLALAVAVLLAPALRADASPAPAKAPSVGAVAVLTGTVAGVVTDAETGSVLVGATVAAGGVEAQTNGSGQYVLVGVPAGRVTVGAAQYGYAAQTASVEVAGDAVARLDLALTRDERTVEETELSDLSGPPPPAMAAPEMRVRRAPTLGGAIRSSTFAGAAMQSAPVTATPLPVDREGYAPVDEVGFRRASDHPLSTFSIDVDRASYANARRFLLREGRLPVPDAVRVEEFVNSFDYGLEGPGAEHPFAVHTEVARAPWADEHRLVRVALQGRRIDTANLQPANLVFLLDVSGSMRAEDKLPLLKKAFRLLVREMRPQDRVAIVV